MLQQTRVATAKRYYQRFIKEFPTVQRLAQAPLDRVLKTWEGLGYYARARNLHRAAKIITRQYNGLIPKSKAELLQLPGIGRYTAGAILSMAYGQDEIVLDGNVRRVLCRVFCVAKNPRLRHVESRLETLLKELLPTGQAGTFNQALMELGSRICLPKAPCCTLCPVRTLCQAKRLGMQDRLPVKAPRRALPQQEVAIGLIWKDGRLLIAQRPPEGLLGGLWEFPGGKRKPNETLEECVQREVREELGITIDVKNHFTSVRHAYSHFRVILHAFECIWRQGKPRARRCTDWAWVEISDLAQYAFPRANQKITAALQASGSKSPARTGRGRVER